MRFVAGGSETASFPDCMVISKEERFRRATLSDVGVDHVTSLTPSPVPRVAQRNSVLVVLITAVVVVGVICCMRRVALVVPESAIDAVLRQ